MPLLFPRSSLSSFSSLLAMFVGAIVSVHAQTLTLAWSASLDGESGPQRPIDYIVALVNSEPITLTDVQREAQRVLQQLAVQRRPVPDEKTFRSDVLEGLIQRRWQLQLAQELGIRVEEAAVDEAERTIASQNQTNVAELRRRVVAEGMGLDRFRSQLREQLLLQRLREKEVIARVTVSELDIDNHLQQQEQAPDLSKLRLHLEQLVVPVPDGASPADVDKLRTLAEALRNHASKGEALSTLATTLSNATLRIAAEDLGVRTADRYPAAFVHAVRHCAQGEVCELVQSGAGFHILKVLEKTNPALPAPWSVEHHTRHILLRPSTSVSEADARSRLTELRRQILAGRIDFAKVAKDLSHDASAAQGGDLGWAGPGVFVPEFEAIIEQLEPGALSEPVISRFGVHLIQLLDRRRVTMPPAQYREAVRATVRALKLEEAYKTWNQAQRAKAYVEYRQAPE
ncbi:peptidylprolyl isomerase [Candidatus Symbiobacter mobilis]|uniref:Chaperone SurA n=1 Tax=Candidatus Symbiobacter mobilis CR TaxID=946483 RepID=U5N969_9BURK|nr:peptidylprolyl isomerase [Candidatus Symbiobacter mobilis]AGX86744.1 peptidyl-prolyl cis-trans isomerase SurA [Candidatus Symbiobacter mobilis CR]